MLCHKPYRFAANHRPCLESVLVDPKEGNLSLGLPYVLRRSKIFRGQLKMGISTVETSGKLIETLRPSADAELFMSRT